MQFDQILQTLNEKQRLAVETLEGPVMLIAGPGSGKTHTLTTRIANILQKTDAKASNILALTFTDNAAVNMRNRLRNLIGKEAYKVKIVTFHAFCNEVIQKFPEKFGFSNGFKQITDLEKIRLIEKIIDDTDLEFLTNFHNTYLYKDAIIKTISDIKKEGYTPDEFLELVKKDQKEYESVNTINPKTGKIYSKWQTVEKNIKKNLELYKLYKAYQDELQTEEMYDYDDMILFVTEQFEHDDELLAHFQEQYLYILVDEFQDTNGSQSKVLELLGNFDAQPNIFVVGDDDQSIFRFQGANVENMYEFIQRYPETGIITLDVSYRCPQEILSGALSMVNKNKNTLAKKIPGLDKNIKSTNKIHSTIEINSFDTSEDEILYVTSQIKELVNSGTNPQEIAVLYRTHLESEQLQTLLRKQEISTNLQDKINIFEHEYVTKFHTILKLINNPDNNELLFEALNYDFINNNRIQLYNLTAAARKSEDSMFKLLIDSETEEYTELKHFAEKILQWQHDSYNSHLVVFFEQLLSETGILGHLKEQHDPEAISAFISLFNFARRISKGNLDYRLKNFLEDIDSLKANRITISLDYSTSKDGVNLMTAHKAKGLEFDYVFVINLIDGKWGNRKVRDKIKLPDSVMDTQKTGQIDPNEEERRLLYVAITRAKKKTILTYSNKSIEDNKERDHVPSQFITEIEEKYARKQALAVDPELKALTLEQLPPVDFNAEETVYLKNKIEKFKLSVTSLNKYLDDPLSFLYENIIQIPKSKTKELIMGTVLHKALEILNKGNKHDIVFYNKLIESTLNKEFITRDEVSVILEEATKLFGSYYNHIDPTAAQNIAEVEYGFWGDKILLDDIELTGKIDAIEWVDKAAKTVKIVDYKTGTYKTRNQILGLTKNADQKLLRQLQFYKLLTELSSNFPYKAVEFELVFIKPDQRGNFRSEKFNSDEIDTESLKPLITNMMQKIRNLDFTK